MTEVLEIKPKVPIHYLSNKDVENMVADCSVCGRDVEIVNYKKYRYGQVQCANKARESGRRSDMRAGLRRRYGITEEEYNALLEKQNRVCAICHKACTSKSRLTVDHDHNTGKVRRLLCHKCNVAIGMAGDKIEILQSAIHYLEFRDSNIGVTGN